MELRGRWRTRDLDHLDDARHLERFLRVVGGDLAAVHRRARDHGEQHAVEQRIDAVGGAAGNDIRTVDEAHLALADIAELVGLLQLQRCTQRHAQARRGLRELAIAELSVGRSMQNLVVNRLHLVHRHAPRGGRRLHEHLARSGAGAAHRSEEVAHAARAIGVLVAEARLVGVGLLHSHALPVGLELIGEHHRQTGAYALPHFLAVADDRHGAIGRDVDEDERVVDPAVRHRIGAVFRRRGCRRRFRSAADDKEQTGRAHRAKKAAAAHVGDDHWPAAFLIAARMRG